MWLLLLLLPPLLPLLLWLLPGQAELTDGEQGTPATPWLALPLLVGEALLPLL